MGWERGVQPGSAASTALLETSAAAVSSASIRGGMRGSGLLWPHPSPGAAAPLRTVLLPNSMSPQRGAAAAAAPGRTVPRDEAMMTRAQYSGSAPLVVFTPYSGSWEQTRKMARQTSVYSRRSLCWRGRAAHAKVERAGGRRQVAHPQPRATQPPGCWLHPAAAGASARSGWAPARGSSAAPAAAAGRRWACAR